MSFFFSGKVIHSRFQAFHSVSPAFHAVLPLVLWGFVYRVLSEFP
ncbi:hypothetical protein CSB67_0723 [Enterobacter hormaechei]|nr:hypothetical protein CSB67_0723 [Enterobacter hormaechei]